MPISLNIENVQIDTAIAKLNEIFESAIEKFVPCIKINQNTLITLSEKSLKLLRTKKSTRRKLFRNKNSPLAISIKIELKLLSNMTYNSIFSDYKSFWERKFSELKIDNNIFKNFKRFSNYKQRSKLPTIMLIDENSETQLISDADKANAFAEHFERAHKLTIKSGSVNFNAEVENYIAEEFEDNHFTNFAAANQDENLNSDNLTPFVNAVTVEEAIKSRNTKKSCGNDKISNFVLKKN